MKGLTSKQQQILDFIQQFIKQHRYSPSYKEIMQYFNFTSPGSVYKYVQTLKRKGVLETEKHSHRSLLPVKSAQVIEQIPELLLPLIGNLSIGYPLELFVHPKMIAVPPSLIQNPENTYIIQIQGNALNEEGIHDGDLLLIEARQNIQPGETILGLINQHDTVLKRYYPEGQYIHLESSLPHVTSLKVRHEHIVIQGVLISLLRMY